MAYNFEETLMAEQIDFRKVAANNPGVDAKKMEQLQAYRALLEKAGMVIKPDYRLSPPLGPIVRDKSERACLSKKLRWY